MRIGGSRCLNEGTYYGAPMRKWEDGVPVGARANPNGPTTTSGGKKSNRKYKRKTKKGGKKYKRKTKKGGKKYTRKTRRKGSRKSRK